MHRILIALSVCIGLVSGAAAQDRMLDLPADPAIQGVIGGQFDAFRSEDLDEAFSFASPNIQEIFRTPENFGGMVRGGYPMVWRPGEIRFLELREIEGRLWKKVRVTDADGTVHVLDYQMIETGNGWKINGVRILDAPVPNV